MHGHLKMLRIGKRQMIGAVFEDGHLGIDSAPPAEQTTEQQREQADMGDDKTGLITLPRIADGGRAKDVDRQQGT